MGARREPAGTRTWISVKSERLAAPAIARVTRRARARIEQLTLQELRQVLAMTQVDVAGTAEMTQSELSRLENRGDHRISTLRRYVEALGGELVRPLPTIRALNLAPASVPQIRRPNSSLTPQKRSRVDRRRTVLGSAKRAPPPFEPDYLGAFSFAALPPARTRATSGIKLVGNCPTMLR
jgi:transcriptional regulator with XRE-family HTH domain